MSVARSLYAVRIVVVAALVAVLAVAVAGSAAATHEVTRARVGKENRFGTAAAIATETYPEGAARVLLARGDAFPDSLAAAPLSRQLDAPILLTRHDSLTAATREALAALDPQEVVLLGGPAAISQGVQARLAGEYQVNRIAGDNRYETAARVARTTASVAGGLGHAQPQGPHIAFVANGERFPDALAAGAPAASQADPFPVLLTRRDSLPAATEAALRGLDIGQVFVVGGEAAVSEHVRERIREVALYGAERLAGDNRLETALEVADFTRAILDFAGTEAVVARGDAFADALAAGPLAGRRRAPVLLTPGPEALGSPARTWVNDMCPGVERVLAVGGPEAVSESVLTDAVEAAERCHGSGGDTNQTYRVDPQQVRTEPPGTRFQFTVAERYDDRALTDGHDAALFPCDAVTATERVVRFDDADGDGFADGIATTRTGSAVFSGDLHEARTRHLEDLPDLHGALEFRVSSDAEDCAVATVFKDTNDDDRLPVDGEGHPLEHFGVGQVVWQR